MPRAPDRSGSMDRYLQIFSRWFPFLVTNIFKYIFTLILDFGKKNQIYFHIPIVGWSAWSEIMSSEVKELFLVFPEWRWWWLVPILGECHHQDNTLTPTIMDLLRTYSHKYHPGPSHSTLSTCILYHINQPTPQALCFMTCSFGLGEIQHYNLGGWE